MSEKKDLPRVKEWIDDNFVDDKEDNLMIAQIAIKELLNNFHIAFTSEETVLAIYAVIFDSIVEVLGNQREKNSSFAINIADRFEIGYSDDEDNEDAEKVGSFVPYIFDLNSGKKTYENTESEDTIENCIEWMSKNCTKNTEIIKKISSVAYKNVVDRLAIHLGQEDVCIPVFVNIHECMISYLKLKQVENDEYETGINFASCFEVFIRRNDVGEQTVEYNPSIAMKLSIKSDAIATAKNE